MNIAEIIFDANQNYKDNIAIYDEQGQLTYGELFSEVTELADKLEFLGLVRGMGVGVMGRNSRQFIISVLALLKLNIIVMPISNQLKTHEVNIILDKSNLHYLLSDDSTPEHEALFIEKVIISDSKWSLNKYADFTGVQFAAHVSDAAIVRYTSGTTGAAKGVIMGHQSINERLDGANACLMLGHEDVVIWVLQMSYHFVVSILLYLKYGSAIVICKNFLADTIFNDTVKYKGTFLYASPLHIRLLSNDKSHELLPTLKRVISTSTAISKTQCDAFYKRYSIPVTQAYGIIEIGLPIINYNHDAEVPDAVGHALDAYNVEVLNEENKILSRGEIGHLGISGPGMFDAYLSPPLSRERVLQNGWFMTGDLASIDKNGLIKIEGRKKSMINVAGNKVFPLEVEHVLDTHPHILRSRVSGYQHRLMGEIVQAEIIKSGQDEIDTEEIIAFCRNKLSTYKVPQKILIVESLPMTDSGKLRRRGSIS